MVEMVRGVAAMRTDQSSSQPQLTHGTLLPGLRAAPLRHHHKCLQIIKNSVSGQLIFSTHKPSKLFTNLRTHLRHWPAMRSRPLQKSPSSSNPAEEPLLGSRPYPNTPPQDADRQHARSHDASDASHPRISEPPPPYAPVPGRCVILPGREARWRTKGKGGVLLSTLAATVLVSEGQLQGGDVELYVLLGCL